MRSGPKIVESRAVSCDLLQTTIVQLNWRTWGPVTRWRMRQNRDVAEAANWNMRWNLAAELKS
mgnify:FL=1